MRFQHVDCLIWQSIFFFFGWFSVNLDNTEWSTIYTIMYIDLFYKSNHSKSQSHLYCNWKLSFVCVSSWCDLSVLLRIDSTYIILFFYFLHYFCSISKSCSIEQNYGLSFKLLCLNNIINQVGFTVSSLGLIQKLKLPIKVNRSY